MRGASFGLLVLLVAVGLAGCADGKGGDEGEDPFDDFGDVDVDKDTGIIRGLVLDPTIRPIAGVLVSLDGTDLNTTTNADGAFLLQGLAPGFYYMKLSKAGFDTVQANAEVEAGVEKPNVVRVQLTPLPGSDPRAVPFDWQGHLGCTLRRWDPPSGGYGQSCPYASLVWEEHDSSTDIELEQVPAYVTSDLVWKSTQQLGGEMSFNLRRGDNGSNCDTVDIEGTSPLHLSMGEAEIAFHEDRCKSQGGFGPDMPLRIAIFTAHLQETEPPTGGWGFGLQVDQPFYTYTHVFYNYKPPADWVFTENSEIPPP